MVWGQIAGAVVGGYMANQAAKKQAGAIDAANRMSNMGYLDAQPYIQFGYSGGKGALQDVLKHRRIHRANLCWPKCNANRRIE